MGPTSLAASAMICQWSFCPLIALEMLVGVLDHDDGSIDHGPDGNGDAAQRHDVGVEALVLHHDEGHQDGKRKSHDGHERRTEMQQEKNTDQGND